MNYKNFVLLLLMWIFMFAFGVASFNVLSDPYGIWRIGQWQGVNRYAIQGEAMERMAKPLAVAGQAPETVILGDSLSNLGLNPAFYEKLTGKRTYNMAVDSASVYEMRRYLEHLLEVDDDLQEVIVEANMAMLYPGSVVQPGFDEQQIGHGFPAPSLMAKAVFSMDAIETGWDSLRLNHKERLAYASHDEEGWLSQGQQLRNYGNIWFYNFLQLNLRQGAERNWQLDWARLDEYKRMRDLCAEHGVKFRLFMPPMSAAALAAMTDAYGEETIKSFWQSMADIAPVYNFSGIGIWNETASAEDRSLFWDANHMKPELGDKVLAVLAGEDAGWAGFGQLIEPSGVQSAVAKQFKDIAAWRLSHQKLWDDALHLGKFAKAAYEMPAVAPGLVHIDALNGHTLPGEPIRLSHAEVIQVSGWSTVYEGKHRIFIALRNSSGDWYVSLAAPVRRDDLLQLTHNPAYVESAGFKAEAALRGLPAGEYQCHIFESEGDNKHLSACLAVVVITGD